MPSRVEAEVEVKSPADKFWAAIRNPTEIYPKLFPEHYKSINILKGDGKSPGSVFQLNFAEGIPFLKYATEKIEVVDDEKKLMKCKVIEGDLLNDHRSFESTVQIAPKGNGGAKVKWSVDFEKTKDEVSTPETIKEMTVHMFKELDAYLLRI